VWALDVGHNQLAWRIRQDPRVEVIEGRNARNLDPAHFPRRFDIASVDVSFISLAKVLPSVYNVLDEFSDCIALVKPQFEVGKGEVGRGGIVTDPARHRRVLFSVENVARSLGFNVMGLIESPILGAEGNREFLIHLRRGGEPALPALLRERIEALTKS